MNKTGSANEPKNKLIEALKKLDGVVGVTVVRPMVDGMVSGIIEGDIEDEHALSTHHGHIIVAVDPAELITMSPGFTVLFE